MQVFHKEIYQNVLLFYMCTWEKGVRACARVCLHVHAGALCVHTPEADGVYLPQSFSLYLPEVGLSLNLVLMIKLV